MSFRTNASPLPIRCLPYGRISAGKYTLLPAVIVPSEPTYRVWRLYMSGSAHGFDRGRLNVYQALLVKPDAEGQSHLPLTRVDWYPVGTR